MNLNELETHDFLEEIPFALLLDETYEKQFKSVFQASCPEIYADIESFVLNGPTCSCSKKIKNYINKNRQKVVKVVWNFFDNKEHIDKYIKQIELKLVPPNLSGKILKTTIQKWPEFAEEISNYSFRSFTVSKEGDSLLVYFL